MEKVLQILLVEDDKMGQTIASRLFRRLGQEIDVANNGKEAIGMLRAKDYDLILMDINMPEMDGVSATRHIRTHLNAPKCNVKIVAMTGHDSESDVNRFLEAGMDDYLKKPLVIQDFFERMNLKSERKIPIQYFASV